MMTEPFEPQRFLRDLTTLPGVYRMLDGAGEVIYVGKARNLKRRVSSYFRSNLDNAKTALMVSQIANIEVLVTHTEGEALILENNLIKELKPRFNILLRDDKSYPYIQLTDHRFPRLTFYRGRPGKRGRFFGPYPSGAAVKESLNLLQKLFKLRPCDEATFTNRSRPCLQYQIERCSGPCVDKIDAEAYAHDVQLASLFLQGRSSEVVEQLVDEMDAAAERLEFERAARLRDQVTALRRVQERQYITGKAGEDVDVVATAERDGSACIQLFVFRDGRNLGNKAFFPQGQGDGGELLDAFISQYYLREERFGGEIPREIIISEPIADKALLESLLSERAGHRVVISSSVRAERSRWVEMAQHNAEIALGNRLNSRATLQTRFDALCEALHLDKIPNRMECFDISHTQGELTVASCVVFDITGPVKADYRRFNIEGITPGDDYAAMHQALTRRFSRLKREEAKMPELLIIDGGKGQMTQARAVISELGITGVKLLGVAKGSTRKPGLEQLFLSGHQQPIILTADSPALHLIQHIRDEAHRFAITGHRQRREKKRGKSPLEAIPGLGPKRRQQLLKQFGGLQEVARAGVEDLQRVRGISKQLAQAIYQTFHSSNG